MSVFNHGALHSQANTEKGKLLFARELDRANHSGNAALAETAWNQDSVELTKVGFAFRFQALGFDPMNPGAEIVHKAAMDQSFAEAFVGILQFHVFSHDPDRYVVDRVIHALDERFPVLHPPFGFPQVEKPYDFFIETFDGEDKRNFVNTVDVLCSDNGFFRDVTEERNFRLHVGRQESIGAAQKNIGLNSDFEQFFHTVLRRFRFQLTGGRNVRNESEVNEKGIFTAHILAHLPDRFEEGQ